MDRAQCTRLVEQFATAREAGDVDVLMDLMAPKCEFRASVGPEPGRSFVGRDAVRDGSEAFLGTPVDGSPPQAEPEPMLVGPDFAVSRWTVVEVSSCADMLADSVRRIFTGNSVSEVFEGQNQVF